MNEIVIFGCKKILKVWHVEKFYIQHLTRFIFFNPKSDTKWNSQFETMLLKKHKKGKICRFQGVKWTKSWLLGGKKFWKSDMLKILNSKSNALYFFQSKFWRFVKLSNQNLTRCKNFKSKSDALYFFLFKIWHVMNISIQNHAFRKAQKK